MSRLPRSRLVKLSAFAVFREAVFFKSSLTFNARYKKYQKINIRKGWEVIGWNNSNCLLWTHIRLFKHWAGGKGGGGLTMMLANTYWCTYNTYTHVNVQTYTGQPKSTVSYLLNRQYCIRLKKYIAFEYSRKNFNADMKQNRKVAILHSSQIRIHVLCWPTTL